ncbi:VOC family protein [Pelagibacterium luteolum]|uniref:Catechol 2,3-dioxygenase n=1 Tax=Pelagibacterium luteolum TaxID=440168 RepID=A0A1G7TEX2_9HYPH|nr:VOC family protein [Pelagibacterium luteolum]SDG33876.1 Catechol 2,3-dioxygenase [Pelagibacterium luteolum]
MKLMHLNLTTTDTAASADFLCTYFGLRNEGGNKGFMMLRDDAGMVITLMKSKAVRYPETFHIGFYPEGEPAVDALYARLTTDGFSVSAPERHHGYSIYVEAPGGFTVEVTA